MSIASIDNGMGWIGPGCGHAHARVSRTVTIWIFWSVRSDLRCTVRLSRSRCRWGGRLLCGRRLLSARITTKDGLHLGCRSVKCLRCNNTDLPRGGPCIVAHFFPIDLLDCLGCIGKVLVSLEWQRRMTVVHLGGQRELLDDQR